MLHSSNRLFLAYCQANGLKPDEPQHLDLFADWWAEMAKEYRQRGEITDREDFIKWVETKGE